MKPNELKAATIALVLSEHYQHTGHIPDTDKTIELMRNIPCEKFNEILTLCAKVDVSKAEIHLSKECGC